MSQEMTPYRITARKQTLTVGDWLRKKTWDYDLLVNQKGLIVCPADFSLKSLQSYETQE